MFLYKAWSDGDQSLSEPHDDEQSKALSLTPRELRDIEKAIKAKSHDIFDASYNQTFRKVSDTNGFTQDEFVTIVEEVTQVYNMIMQMAYG